MQIYHPDEYIIVPELWIQEGSDTLEGKSMNEYCVVELKAIKKVLDAVNVLKALSCSSSVQTWPHKSSTCIAEDVLSSPRRKQ